MRAPADVARALGLKAGELRAVQVRRSALPVGARARRTPVVLDDIWLPGALFKGLTAERLAATAGRCTACSRPSSACA
jgi:GntR family transcriptional regulator